jgi:hypothetical protein
VTLTLAVLFVRSHIAGAVAELAHEVHQLREPKADADLQTSVEASLENLNETVDSLHRLFGGRQGQRDELDKDLVRTDHPESLEIYRCQSEGDDPAGVGRIEVDRRC